MTPGKVGQRFYWAKCRVDVHAWCRRCDIYAAKKCTGKKARSPLQLYDMGYIYEEYSAGLHGSFPGDQGWGPTSVGSDRLFMKWPEVYPLPSHEASTFALVVVNELLSKFRVCCVHRDVPVIGHPQVEDDCSTSTV